MDPVCASCRRGHPADECPHDATGVPPSPPSQGVGHGRAHAAKLHRTRPGRPDHEPDHRRRAARPCLGQRGRALRVRAAVPGDRPVPGDARRRTASASCRCGTRPPPCTWPKASTRPRARSRWCSATPGPGTANLIPGLVTARHEGVPVIAITSQHRAGIVYPVDAGDLPGPGPARPVQARGEVGRTGVRVDAHPRARAHGLPRDVGRPAGSGAPRDARGRRCTPRAIRPRRRSSRTRRGRAGPPQASEAQLEAAARAARERQNAR